MTQQEFIQLTQKQRRQLDDLFRRKLPVEVGALAVDHFRENFHKGGLVNKGLHKWQPAKRLTSGRGGAPSKYGTLLSSRTHLLRSVMYVPGDGRVTISNPVPYAAAHQYGETIHVPITDKMRRFAWARYYRANGVPPKGEKRKRSAKPDDVEAAFWKGLALTRKTALNIKLPARPFIGESAELTKKIGETIDARVGQILNL